MRHRAALLCLLLAVILSPTRSAAAEEISPGLSPSIEERTDRGRELLRAGRFAHAESLARALVQEAETKSGPHSTQVASALDLLASSLLALGRATKLETREVIERAIAIKETVYGPQHPELARSLTHLGNLFFELGDLGSAHGAQERALAILEPFGGPDHPLVGASLNNLAHVLDLTGDVEGALRLDERILAIRERALGPDHPEVAMSLNNLATHMQRAGQIAQAQAKLERSAAILERALGSEHPTLSLTLLNLAGLDWAAGDSAAARERIERARIIRENAMGADHPGVAQCLGMLAAIHLIHGDLPSARRLQERALSILITSLGEDHPFVSEATRLLAEIRAASGHHAEGLDLALRTEEISRRHLLLTARTLPERQALLYATSRYSGRDLALSIASREHSDRPETIIRVWDSVLHSRGLILDEMAARNRSVSLTEHATCTANL